MLPGSLNAFTEFLLRKALKSKQRLLKNGTITTKSFWDKIILRYCNYVCTSYVT